MKKIKLFCLPYAGGSAMVYHRWKSYLASNIDLHAVELAGRGSRIYERFYESISEAVEDVYGGIHKQLCEGPYAFFGHSMGSIIVYELTQRILHNGLSAPMHLFFSGRGAPDVIDKDEKIFHTMPVDVFRKEVLELGGTPRELFEHPELLELVLPLLKNDFKIHERYKFDGQLKPFDFDITVLVGKDDEQTAEQVHGWRRHTNKLCKVYYFDGNHFFINGYAEDVVRIINQTLEGGLYA